MRIVAIEEHVFDLGLTRASAPELMRLSPHFEEAFDATRGYNHSPTPDVLFEAGERRIADMDANGITMQVLSRGGAQQAPADVALDLCHAANDTLADTVANHPGRFAGFAALPTALPDAAADELDRCINDLGFVGTLVMGRTGGEFLSAERFEPVLARAESLRVPIYLHPSPPPAETSATNYEGLSPVVTARFQTAGWGWHQETGVHFLHMVLSGVFDRHPDLQIILGHWGELVPFFAARLDQSLPRNITGLARDMSDYLRQNAHITPSGIWSHANLRYCIDVVGLDRIMFSVDYPFVDNEGALAFLTSSGLDAAAIEVIAHRNAEALLGV